MKACDHLPVAALKQLVRLDPETGRLYWLPREPVWFPPGYRSSLHSCRIWNARWAGKEAFTTNDHGYRRGKVFAKFIPAHRVVFALTHGRWPDGDIDHRDDGDKGNNLPSNLREATRSQNLFNRGGMPNTTSRYCGVSFHTVTGKWRAACKGLDANPHLGEFANEEDAARAYDVAARERHGEFARLNFPLVFA